MHTLPIIGLALALGAPALKEPGPPFPVGEWVLVEMTRDGKTYSLKDERWEFTRGGRFSVRRAGKESMAGEYTADPDKALPAIDLTRDDTITYLGIYKVEGETLTICANAYHRGNRPVKFDSPGGAQIMLLTFKRAKAK